jgi:hypothetical protein
MDFNALNTPETDHVTIRKYFKLTIMNYKSEHRSVKEAYLELDTNEDQLTSWSRDSGDKVPGSIANLQWTNTYKLYDLTAHLDTKTGTVFFKQNGKTIEGKNKKDDKVVVGKF